MSGNVACAMNYHKFPLLATTERLESLVKVAPL